MNWKSWPIVEGARKTLSPVKPLLEFLVQVECRLARAWARSAHHRLMLIQWGILPQPEHFDHHIDLSYFWQKSRNPQWVERGVYGALCLKGGRVLELCCGDGFNARNFYSLKAESVIACDFDAAALKTARRLNRAPNVRFVRADIRTQMPEGRFDNIVWDASIEHFTSKEIDSILKNIKDRLGMDGIISGHTLAEKGNAHSHHSHHKHTFQDMDDLRRFFTPYFKNVRVFETVYPGRHNLYFWASDGPIPFSSQWHGTRM